MTANIERYIQNKTYKTRKIKLVLFIFFLCFCTTEKGLSQSFENCTVKEKFDDIYLSSYNSGGFYPIDELIYNSEVEEYVPSNLGTYHAGSLEALLVLYETTKDKAYLYKYIDKAIRIQGLKNGGSMTADPYLWTTASFYINGRIVASMTHFVYLVFSSNDLYSAPIYDPALYGNFSTFGEFSEWLKIKVLGTLNFAATNYWCEARDCFHKDDCGDFHRPAKGFYRDKFIQNDTCKKDVSPAAEVNKQAPWGVALTYAWRFTYNEPDNLLYADRLATLASLYHNSALHYFPFDSWPFYNSYWWYHKGFNCNAPDDFVEDNGHAIYDIWFPATYNKFYDELYGNITNDAFFSDETMTRFRNTFTKNIYAATENGFHYYVDGSGTISTFNNSPVQAQQCLGWMPVYKWDGWDNTATSPDVYDIIMDYYTTNLEGITKSFIENNGINSGDFFDGARMMGFGNVVSAQWDKECNNLTLKNRDVVYDQNFFAKNDLTVDPLAPNSYDPANLNSFADPVISTPDFIIEPGKTVNMVAGNSIHLKPGFHARSGCSFHAYIDPSLCNQGMAIKSFAINNQPQTPESSFYKKEEIISEKISIYPNPGNGIFTVSCTFQIQKIEVTDLLGSVIYYNNSLLSDAANLDLSAFPKGCYFIRVASQNKTWCEKLVIQ